MASHRTETPGCPFEDNPLLSDSAAVWDQLIESVGPASLLVVIETRLGTALRRALTAEDILQEALLHAWRDRASFRWQGPRSFRAWLLTIIDNRIREAADRLAALKRGGGTEPVVLSDLSGGRHGSTADQSWGPVGSTTPSKVAVFREQAEAMRAALACLPDDVREVVRLRLFEQLALGEIAERLGLGEAAVRHRFRRGAEQYEQKLRLLLTGGFSESSPVAPQSGVNSSPE